MRKRELSISDFLMQKRRERDQLYAQTVKSTDHWMERSYLKGRKIRPGDAEDNVSYTIGDNSFFELEGIGFPSRVRGFPSRQSVLISHPNDVSDSVIEV